MLPRERIEEIKKIAIKDKKVYVSKLSEKFEVTEETIRRDLEKLELEGIVIRSYGGALLNSDKINEDVPFSKRSKHNIQSKEKIAEKFIKYVNQGNTIMADCSSTVLEVLRLTRNRNDITIITNSLEVYQEFKQSDVNIISTGGKLARKSLSFQGIITKSTLEKYNVDIAVISCSGLDINKGILDSNENEAEIKRCMIKQADKVFLLVDNTKFNRTAFVKLLDYDDIDYVITDEKPEQGWIDLLSTNNVEVIY